MAVSTKRKNSLKSKSNSKTRKQFKKFRKTKKNVRKMRGGGDGDIEIFKGHTGAVMSVSFSPDLDGKYICSGSTDTSVLLWNVDTGENIRTLNGHTDYVRSVSFSTDGKFICSGSWDNTVRLWNISKIEEEEQERKEILGTYFGENVVSNSISLDIISDPHIASDGKSYTPEIFKQLFPKDNNTFIPISPITREALIQINPQATYYYKKFLKPNFMLRDALEHFVKKEKEKKKKTENRKIVKYFHQSS